MCFKFSRTPLLALVVGIYLELSIRNGICDDSQLSSSSYQNSNKNLSNRHAHHNWKGWEDWIPSPTTTENQQQRHNHDIPFSITEQAKLRYRRNRTEKKLADKQQQQQRSQQGQPRSSKNTIEKTVQSNLQEGDSILDINSLRDTARTLATTVMNHFMSSWSSPSSTHKSAASESNIPRSSRAVYLDNLGERQEGPNYGKPEGASKRGVIDWLSRLIGVQGKTLGEFLREYQVHVLYDLAFTFFKWIFFLYAGLLIP